MEAVCPGHRINVHEYESKSGDDSQLHLSRGRMSGDVLKGA